MIRFGKTVAALSLAGMAIFGAALAMPGGGEQAENAEYCVIPASSANYQQIKLSASDEDFSEILNFHITERQINGILPTRAENVVRETESAEFPVCPITEEEIVMLAKVIKREAGGITWDAYGMSGKARQAAVAWCALNRLDDPRFPDTLKGVLTYPNAFAWIPDTAVTDDLLDLAKDVVERWCKEKNGETDVGRTLPANYYFFHGDGRENHFRDKYSGNFTYWDWSLADPYTEE